MSFWLYKLIYKSFYLNNCRENSLARLLALNNLMSHEQHTKHEVTVINSARVPFILVLLMWFVFIIEWAFQLKGISNWGIYPRHIDGLWGLLFSPFIHGGFEHIINNTPPIFILTWALFYFYRRIFWMGTAKKILLLR